jgi:hypothetical protein
MSRLVVVREKVSLSPIFRNQVAGQAHNPRERRLSSARTTTRLRHLLLAASSALLLSRRGLGFHVRFADLAAVLCVGTLANQSSHVLICWAAGALDLAVLVLAVLVLSASLDRLAHLEVVVEEMEKNPRLALRALQQRIAPSAAPCPWMEKR